MSIGTPALIASINNTQTASVSSYTGTTTNAAVANAPLIALVFWDTPNSIDVSSISDGTANSYQKAVMTPEGSGQHVEIWYCAKPVAVPASSTITVTLSSACGISGTSAQGIYIYQVSGLVLSSVLDQAAENFNQSSSLTTLSCSTNALATPNEIAIGCAYAGHSTSYTVAPGFTNLTSFAGAGGNGVVGIDYQTVGSTAAITYAPTWSAAGSDNAVAMATFIGATQVPYSPVTQLGPVQAQ
jgi:hypothetical protein